ncbi:MAG: ferredoxin [Candidatus Komeilibacteria bacterium CG11_big_fil_rev_8_21_14_0_20_36_20]|uniref:Ferredoxin n=1 Tax=Candidatus Komeilibacteria bacterium CG11_big_fil_rev_8_21_14_0_20_36_20 TaxID=1974477 RepID=A0A2H0NDJ2_9BACT|nr:MAG: ferredoxin [Candidatus Komeilibacteria bacterium CG11_big_fil_rev_8_21_14_0_20_36_20]PIR81305.1 MAG: ferredoxin [Candidatus Komeilibacteria bacterium CG10_big_fil_rev_8_21_14_0_10_36_65]PJC54935.1 MAG: ferredoxin [Candidatus Komeilibacteria bacterium CG_4_9_14_0_2_um_filter_36_13]
MIKEKKIKITIDGLAIQVSADQTIGKVARANNIKIPGLCFHPDLAVQASCRLCVVEIKGRKGLYTACSTKIEEGMDIVTDSSKIRRARKVNLELIFTQHCEECGDCIYKRNCTIRELAPKYKVNITKFPDRKKDYPVYKFGPSLIFDSSKCIDCNLCVEACKAQNVCFLETRKKGDFHDVVPSKDKNKDCIYCGQCLTHCPVGAFEGVGEFEEIEAPFQLKDKVVVVQFAPSIRTTIGEEFDMPHGSIVTGQLTAAIRQLGIKHVFDVSVGADFTTIAEADELIERITEKGVLPMMTSCCPGWVKYVEFFQPEFIPNLTTVRSPHIILGGLIKTYWAKKEKIDPKKIVVVSIMPCVAKKYEMTRPELKINGLRPVDYVFTTRELAWLLKKRKIDLSKVQPENIKDPFGVPTGAGVIYGASGGVMESALRTACGKISGQQLCPINFKQARGLDGVKKATLTIKGKKLKIAIANGTANAQKLLDELKEKPKAYDYIEIMACPGGCIGGGGQPVPVNAIIRQKRANSLYSIDTKKKKRLAEDNSIVKKVYQDFFNDHHKFHQVCHTKFRRKNKEVKT